MLYQLHNILYDTKGTFKKTNNHNNEFSKYCQLQENIPATSDQFAFCSSYFILCGGSFLATYINSFLFSPFIQSIHLHSMDTSFLPIIIWAWSIAFYQEHWGENLLGLMMISGNPAELMSKPTCPCPQTHDSSTLLEWALDPVAADILTQGRKWGYANVFRRVYGGTSWEAYSNRLCKHCCPLVMHYLHYLIIEVLEKQPFDYKMCVGFIIQKMSLLLLAKICGAEKKVDANVFLTEILWTQL